MEAEADAIPEATRKPPKTAFKEGNDVGKHGQKGKPLKKKRGETELEAMRWVLSNPENVTYLQREMRKALRQDRQKFLDRMLALEKVLSERMAAAPGPVGSDSNGAGSSNTPAPTGAVPAPDVGTARCVELLEGLIKRLRESRGPTT